MRECSAPAECNASHLGTAYLDLNPGLKAKLSVEMSTHARKIIIPFHVMACIGVFVMIAHPHLWIWALLVWFLVGVLGAGIGYHRLLAHQSFKCRSWVRYTLTILGALVGQGSPIFWVALHADHHRHADHEEDIHTPQKSFWWAYLGWQLKPFDHKINWLSIKHLARDPWMLFIHRHYYKIIWGVTGALLLMDWHLATACFALPIVVYCHQMNFVDAAGHLSFGGYRNFPTADFSYNRLFTSYLLLGGAYHNNHHARPSHYSFQCRWFEFDFGAWIVLFLRWI